MSPPCFGLAKKPIKWFSRSIKKGRLPSTPQPAMPADCMSISNCASTTATLRIADEVTSEQRLLHLPANLSDVSLEDHLNRATYDSLDGQIAQPSEVSNLSCVGGKEPIAIGPLGFFCLPAEVRILVYEFLLLEDGAEFSLRTFTFEKPLSHVSCRAYTSGATLCGSSTRCASIMASRRLFDEVVAVFYTKTQFDLDFYAPLRCGSPLRVLGRPLQMGIDIERLCRLRIRLCVVAFAAAREMVDWSLLGRMRSLKTLRVVFHHYLVAEVVLQRPTILEEFAQAIARFTNPNATIDWETGPDDIAGWPPSPRDLAQSLTEQMAPFQGIDFGIGNENAASNDTDANKDTLGIEASSLEETDVEESNDEEWRANL